MNLQLGNKIYIGPNALIVGNIIIGNDVINGGTLFSHINSANLLFY
jgi:hypothetical protein